MKFMEGVQIMAKLSSKERKQLPASAFVFPKKRAYPIHDKTHARAALAMVAAHGNEYEKRKVRAAVRKKYPSIDVSGKKNKK